MNSILSLTPAQLREAADLQEKIFELRSRLDQILGASAELPVALPVAAAPAKGKGKGNRRLSPQGLANIRAGVRKREAARAMAVAGKGPVAGGARFASRMTPEGRAALAAKLRARWARVKASGKTKL